MARFVWLVAVVVSLSSGTALAADDPCAELMKRFAGGSGVAGNTPATEFASLGKDASRTGAHQRSCFHTFPWPKDFDETAAAANTTSAKADEIRKGVYALESGYVQFEATLSAVLRLKLRDRILSDDNDGRASVIVALMKVKHLDVPAAKYYTTRLAGGTSEQTRLWAEFYYISRLMAEQNYDQAIAVAAELRGAGRLAVVPEPATQLDESTYFSEQTLRNIICGLELVARKRSLPAAPDPASVVDLTARYLDALPGLNSSAPSLGGIVDDALLPDHFLVDLPFSVVNAAPAAAEVAWPGAFAGWAGDASADTLFFHGRDGQLHAVDLPVGGPPRVLSAERAVDRLQDFSRHEVTARSTDQMRLFNVFADANSYLVDLPDGQTFRVSKQQMADVRAGGTLPDDHPLNRFLTAGNAPRVMYSNPLIQRPGTDLSTARDFVLDLQRGYPNTQLYLDPLSARTEGLVNTVDAAVPRASSDVVVVAADRSFKVKDGNVVNNLLEHCRAAGVPVVRFNGAGGPQWAGATGKAVIVITGHSAVEMQSYVEALGEAGYLKGNMVVFNTCETPLTDQLVRLINQKYGAVSTFTYAGAISANAVRDAVSAFIGDLETSIGQGRRSKLTDMLRAAVRGSKLVGVWVVCEADESRDQVGGSDA